MRCIVQCCDADTFLCKNCTLAKVNAHDKFERIRQLITVQKSNVLPEELDAVQQVLIVQQQVNEVRKKCELVRKKRNLLREALKATEEETRKTSQEIEMISKACAKLGESRTARSAKFQRRLINMENLNSKILSAKKAVVHKGLKSMTPLNNSGHDVVSVCRELSSSTDNVIAYLLSADFSLFNVTWVYFSQMIQLVQILMQSFPDLSCFYELDYFDVMCWRVWTPMQFHTEFFKLCCNVLSICAYCRVPHKDLVFYEPLSNLKKILASGHGENYVDIDIMIAARDAFTWEERLHDQDYDCVDDADYPNAE